MFCYYIIFSIFVINCFDKSFKVVIITENKSPESAHTIGEKTKLTLFLHNLQVVLQLKSVAHAKRFNSFKTLQQKKEQKCWMNSLLYRRSFIDQGTYILNSVFSSDEVGLVVSWKRIWRPIFSGEIINLEMILLGYCHSIYKPIH